MTTGASSEDTPVLPEPWQVFVQEMSVELARVSFQDWLTSWGGQPTDALEWSAALTDTVTRGLGPRVLEAQKLPAAAQAIAALPEICGFAEARGVMISLEKIGHQHRAPAFFMRALGGIPSTLLLLERAGAEARSLRQAQLQNVMAAVRVVGLAVRARVPDAIILAGVSARLPRRVV